MEITGNTCPRGAAYAEAEVYHPERTLTTTMRCTDGQVVSVKTDRPVPKAALMDCMRQVNAARAVLPVSIGDILLRDVWGSNVVATENRQPLSNMFENTFPEKGVPSPAGQNSSPDGTGYGNKFA